MPHAHAHEQHDVDAQAPQNPRDVGEADLASFLVEAAYRASHPMLRSSYLSYVQCAYADRHPLPVGARSGTLSETLAGQAQAAPTLAAPATADDVPHLILDLAIEPEVDPWNSDMRQFSRRTTRMLVVLATIVAIALPVGPTLGAREMPFEVLVPGKPDEVLVSLDGGIPRSSPAQVLRLPVDHIQPSWLQWQFLRADPDASVSTGDGGVALITGVGEQIDLPPTIFGDTARVKAAAAPKAKGVPDFVHPSDPDDLLARSEQVTAYVAARLAGRPAAITGIGVAVRGTLPDEIATSPEYTIEQRAAVGVLEPPMTGMVITHADGNRITTWSQLRTYAATRGPGATVSLRYSSGIEWTYTFPRADDASYRRWGPIGFIASTVAPHASTDPAIRFARNANKGDSASLSQVLAAYAAILDTDIATGRTIASTGTVFEDGTVYPAAGLKQKIEGAASAEVDLIVVPRGNEAEARRLAKGRFDVLGVDTMRQAVDALEAGPGDG